ALIPTTTSGGLKLAWVSQLTVATVCLSPWRAPSTNSPYGIIRSAFFFEFSSISFSPGFLAASSPARRPPLAVRAGARPHKMLQFPVSKECINAVEQVKDVHHHLAQRSRPLRHRRAMGRRPRQHLSAREPAPRLPMQGMRRSDRRRDTAREPAAFAAISPG